MRWLLVLMVGCWILLIPPGAGPDEPAHTVRGAATVRGDFSGEPVADSPGYRRYDVPNWAGRPDPVCYAFDPLAPASCLGAVAWPEPTDPPVAVRPSDAPFWGSALAGFGTLLPRRWGATWAPRLLDAALPTALIASALSRARRSGRMLSAAVLLAVTPMAWFSVAVVNPSGLAISGGLALWVGLGLRAAHQERAQPSSLLAALGWAALVLPRRDGLIWASLIVASYVLVAGDDPRQIWRWLRPLERAAVVGSSLLFAGWAISASTDGSKAMLAAPAAIWLAWLARVGWRRSIGARVAVLVAAGLAFPAGLLAASQIRASGFQSVLLRLTIEETGANLIEAVGVLGWLDTVVPTPALFVFCAMVGILVAAALAEPSGSPWAIGAGFVVVLTVVTSWLLEMTIERYDGGYWQGRYSLPLLIGFPVLLGIADHVGAATSRSRERVAPVVAVGAALVGNLALLGAARRWGVGAEGSLLPWKWDTYDAPVPVVVLLIVHAGASGLLVRVLMGGRDVDRRVDPPEPILIGPDRWPS